MPITNAHLLPFHPLAKNFPLMNGSEFNELVADVKANNGLHEPITLYQGKILDGRNRYRACLNAKIEPRFEGFEGNNAAALAFVISKNIHRRHLKAKEKREAIAKLIKAAPEKSDRQIGKQIGAHHTTVSTVRKAEEARGEISHVETRTDTKGRKQPAKKKTDAAKRAAADRRALGGGAKAQREHEAERQAIAADLAWHAAYEVEAEQLAVDLIKVDRKLAQRVQAHLGHGIALGDALGRGLGSEGNDTDAGASAETTALAPSIENAPAPDVDADNAQIIATNADGLGIPEGLRRYPVAP